MSGKELISVFGIFFLNNSMIDLKRAGIFAILLWLCCFLLPPIVLSQEKVIELLENKVDSMEESLIKIDAYTALIRAYSYSGDSPRKYKVLDEAEQLAEKLGDKKGLGLVYLFRSIEKWNLGLDDISSEYLQKAIHLGDEVGDKDFQLMCAYNLAEVYIYGKRDFAKALEILEKAIKNYGPEAGPKNLGNSYRIMGNVYFEKGDTIRAIQATRKGLDLFLSIKEGVPIDPELGIISHMYIDQGEMNEAQSYMQIGLIFDLQNKMNLALPYYLKAEEIFQKWGAPFFLGRAQSAAGKSYGMQDDYATALSYFQAAKENFHISKNPYFEANAVFLMGNTFMKLKDFEEAKSFTQDALRYFQGINDTLAISETHSALSAIFFQQKMYDEAIKSSLAARELSKSLKDSVILATIAMNLGNTFFEQGNFKDAYQEHQDALSIRKKFNIPHSINYLRLAKLFYAWGKMDSTSHYLDLCFQAANPDLNKEIIKEAHLLKSELYANSGNYQAALAEYKSFFRKFEEIYTEDAQEIAKTEQTRQNVTLYQKEKETAEANAELLAERNRLYLLLGVILTALLLLSVILFLRLRSSTRALSQQKAELEALNQTKDKFFSIIAHDIRSPMLALQSVGKQMEFNVRKGRHDKLISLSQMVAQTTAKLDDLLNNLLNWALSQRGLMPYQPRFLSLQELVRESKDLFAGALEAKEIVLTEEIPDEQMVMADESALHGTFRNLLSNAIKFTPQGGEIHISAHPYQEELRVKIQDSGTGIPEKHLEKIFSLDGTTQTGTEGEKGTGLGLILCKEMIKLNKGKLSVKSKVGEGTRVEFSLPLN
ncbi:MAG: tetratricopeptide repeat protein [Bacteroidota bacterium]